MRRLLVLASIVIVSRVLLAQAPAGVLTGVVTGHTGAPVPNAPVQAKNRQSGAVARAVTSADGRYRLTPLAAGSYDISIVMPCCAFEPFAQQNIAIQAGQTRQLDVRLAEGFSLNTLGDDPGTLAGVLRNRAKVPSGPAPRLGGKPDFSGVWLANEDRYPEEPALLPWAAAAARAPARRSRLSGLAMGPAINPIRRWPSACR